LACCAVCAGALADVHLVRRTNGSAMIYNDVGSGWTVNGRAPTDAYLVEQRHAATPFDAAIEKAAKREGVDPALVKSVMLVESNFDPRAVSRKGARGLMQLMPQTASLYGVQDRFNALESIRAGVRHLARLLSAYSGNVTLALAAYNAGEAAVSRHAGVPPYPETHEYVRRTMVAWRGERVPVVGGGFKGVPTSPPRKANVKVASLNGGLVMSNVDGSERVAPVLGRVR
jgi:hypothetical protein